MTNDTIVAGTAATLLSKEPKSRAQLTLIGMSVLGQAMEGNGNAIAMILVGQYDQEISAIFQYRVEFDEKLSDDSVSANHPRVVQALENTKFYLRSQVKDLFEREARHKRHQQEHARVQRIDAVLSELRNSNKPHPMGTVSELAEKLGVSKSEIRRRKTEGTLGELLAEKMAQ